jgi:hypothetical protein
MSLMSLLEVLEIVRAQPHAYLTSRRLRSLATFLAGRDLALSHLGIDEWGDLPIVARVERHFGASTMPWRNWIDVVEAFAADEWDAFERFLALAATWNDTTPRQPSAIAEPPPLTAVLDEIVARPATHLGEKSVFQLADFLRGYCHTIDCATPHGGGLTQELKRFWARLSLSDERGLPWYKVLRFAAYSDEAAFDDFFARWRGDDGSIDIVI